LRNQPNPSYNLLPVSGYIVLALFAILLLGAIIFWRERMLFCDASYIFFYIANWEQLIIQQSRYGSFVTQIFPYLSTQMQWPLQTGLLLYSMSFNLFYLAVASVLVVVYREYGLAILMGFYFTLFISQGYFWTNNEVHQGVAWMFLLFGTAFYLAKRNVPLVWQIVAFIPLTFLAIFTHPTVMFPTSFLAGFFVMQKEKLPFSKWAYRIFGIVLVVLSALKLWTASQGSYDKGRMTPIMEMNFDAVDRALTSVVADTFFWKSLTEYWLLPVLTLIGIIALIQQKRYWLLGFTLLTSALYFTAVCLAFQQFLTFYIESQFMPLTIALCVPFVFLFLPKLRPRTVVIALILIFGIRLGYIAAAAPKFIERRAWIENVLADMRAQNINKAYILSTDMNVRETLILHWALPIESILASSLAGDKPRKTVTVLTESEVESRLPEENSRMISAFENIPWERTDTYYFPFDTTSNYERIVPPKY